MPDTGKNYSRPSFEEKWRRRFIKFSENDDDAGIAGWSTAGLEARFRHFSKAWPGDAVGALWLDVGCGAGTYTRFLASHNIEVVGMDYSYPTVVKARERAREGLLWVAADATQLPFNNKTVDGIMCFGVIQALERSDSVMRELVRTVKPGGQVWVDALNGWCLPSIWERLVRWIKGRPLHLRYESPGYLCRLMEAQGCEYVRVYWVPIFPHSLRSCQWIIETPLARWLLRYIPFVGAVFSHAFVLQGRRVKGA